LRIKIAGAELRAFVSHVNQPEFLDMRLDKTETPAGVNAANLYIIIQKSEFKFFAFVIRALLSVIFSWSGIGIDKELAAGIIQSQLGDNKTGV